ncbi:hypothetical protein D4Z93_10555 [Clostridium fermenticellae]|uniref:DUF3784 domain-containing protein n=1 Tax=Clostridium fermenticellae TaxID=2068654 RepID=A0A386H5L0_9CLOT|nr:hypothetical protein [Clostridium fermenticellae]AYD40936.1 hypothetical protein D4Z93_10555 [Clostridium fermenticellae]
MDATMNNLILLLGIGGIIQGLGMKYSKSVRKKFKIDSEKVNQKYMNFKINFLIVTGALLLVIQLIDYFNHQLGNKLYIFLPAYLLAAITIDMVYRNRMIKKSRKSKKN